MQKEQVLHDFGLTKAEVQLYLTLLSIGEGTATELAKKTNTNRTFTYDRLKKLLGTGLVSYTVKDNKKYFKPAEPSQLLAILKEKEEQIKEVLPELEKLKAPRMEGPDVNIFSSKKGIRTALNLILKDRKQVYIYGSIERFRKSMESFYTIWNTQRVKEKIHVKVLSNEEIQMELAETDILPEEERSSITTFTFGDKVIIVLWGDIPVAILIENEEIARDNIAFFNAIWEREIKIYSGVQGIVKAFYELISTPSSAHWGIGYSWALAQVYGKQMSDDWHQVRLKNGIVSRLLSYDDARSQEYFRARMKHWRDFNIRFLDKDICGPACITLSDHMIATFIYTEKKLKVIVSKNKETISAYKRYLETLWEKAER